MRLVFLIVILLIAYGSLFPFDFKNVDLSEVDWFSWLVTLEHRTTRGDILGNILLFIPYGFFGALSLADQSKRTRRIGSVLLFVIGFVFALLLQVVQLYLPSRVASAGDAVINLIGLTLGFLAARLVGSAWIARWFGQDEMTSKLSIPLILCVCWLGYLWFPFIPSFDWQQIKNSIKPLLSWHAVSPFSMMDKFIAWSLFFTFLEKITPWQQKMLHRWIFLGIVVVGEIFIIRNVMSLNSWIGATLAIVLFQQIRQVAIPWLAAGLLTWIIIKGLHPFTWNAFPKSFSWVPFSGFLRGSMWFNSFVLFEKLFFYGSCFYLMSRVLTRWHWAALWLVSGLLTVEILQIWIGNHYPEITDPVIALLLSIGLGHLAHSTSTSEQKNRETVTSV